MSGDGPDRGWAGASACREGRSRFGADRRAWELGAEGEAIVGRMLDDLPDVLTLHDRAMPGRAANIDHLAIAPTGVFVIDAKHYRGEPRADSPDGRRDAPDRRLYVGEEDRTELVDSVRWQARVVEAILDEPGLPVRAVLCFVGSTWTITNGLLVHGVGVTSPDRLVELLTTAGPLDAVARAALHRRLRASLSPA